MLGATLVFAGSLMCQAVPPPKPAPDRDLGATATPVDAELVEKLLKAKRIYVESFGEDQVSKTLEAMVIDAFRASRRFIITENRQKADLILKGIALERTSQELHAVGSGTAVAGAAGGHSATISGQSSHVGGVGSASISGSSRGGFSARSMAIEDSQASTETVETARISVRLLSTDGDVVWSTTQESRGAKYKGASADVAEKVIRQLLRDLEKFARPTLQQ